MVKLIAEIGVNHEGSLERALDMVRDAHLAGVDAVKFQTYKASELATKRAKSYWDTTKETTESQYDLFKQHEMSDISWYSRIKDECNTLGIEFMTTLFSLSLIEEYAPLLNCFKISSSDITNRQLLSALLKYKKPIYISTGASTLHEIQELLNFIETKDHLAEITLMHCVLNYPCNKENANLGAIKSLKQTFPRYNIGYSCHVPGSAGIECCRIAAILGVSVIEKHFSPCGLRVGNDHYHALDARQFHELNSLINDDKVKIGKGLFNTEGQEDARLYARRGLYFNKTLFKGDTITERDLISLRPRKGTLPADMFYDIIGTTITRDVKEGDPISNLDIQLSNQNSRELE